MISPVPTDPPSPSTIPAYLVGLSPSPNYGTNETGGVLAPLGAGVADSGPSPGSGGANTRSEIKSNGPPLPFLFLGLVVASMGAGFLLYRYAPRGRTLPAKRAASAMAFTPYGSDAATANLMDPTVNRPLD